MAIPESQLETWTHIGAQQQSAATYQSIKGVLEHKDAPYASRQIDSFLQGSYGNDTNIFGADSDVDIVLRSRAFLHYNIDAVSEPEKAEFRKIHPTPAEYQLKHLKTDVQAWLNKCYGADVDTSGKKAIHLKANGDRRSSDILLVGPYRKYSRYYGEQDKEFVEGILFITTDGVSIVNYPKQHSESMTRKHQVTSNRLKPTVRIYKNMRNKMVEKGFLKKGGAPSYFLEGLLYNVPKEQFGSSNAATIENTYTWIHNNAPADYMCANGIHPLIRDTAHTSWPVQSYIDWLDGMKRLWNSW